MVEVERAWGLDAGCIPDMRRARQSYWCVAVAQGWVVDVIALGAALVLVGLIVLVIEAHAAVGGVLGIAGVLTSAVGIGLLIGGSGAGPLVAIPVSVVVAAGGVGAVAVIARKVMTAWQSDAKSGPSRLVGSPAIVCSWSGNEGQVAADGALWRACAGLGWDDETVPAPGESVIIEQLKGLTLSVRRRQSWELDSS